jgi:hypothetical protein
MVYALLLSWLLLISVVSSSAVDKVVFSWVDDYGVSQSITDTAAPWSLPGSDDGKNVPFLYLSTPGKKLITATAFSLENVVKSKVLEFEVIDSSAGQCDNLIANSDMSLGNKGYWRASRFGKFQSASQVFGQPATAIRYSRRLIRRGGPIYLTEQNMDYSCLTPGSSWEISTSLALLKSNNDGEFCVLGLNCPMITMSVSDSAGDVVFELLSRDYEETDWSNDSWNRIRKEFTLPSSDRWDGSVGSVVVKINGYTGTADLLVDDFSIVPL